MKLHLQPYSLRLHTPISLGGWKLNERAGVLARVETKSGAVGWGDAAPLPGFSRESLEEVHAELTALVVDCEPRSVLELRAWSESIKNLTPSSRFAVESAVVSASAAEAEKSVSEWLFGGTADTCEVNGLIVEAPELWAERTRALASEGFSVVKIKVGRFPSAHELAGLRAAVAAAPDVRFRLDANRAWISLTARAFATEIVGLPVEYIEEPFEGGHGIPRGWPEGVSIAWDETLQEGVDLMSAHPPVRTWVVKPTLLGGIVRCLALVERAKEIGGQVVFSSAYESGVGVRMLAELAAGTGGVAGLDAYRALAEDVLEPQLKISGGRLDLTAARRSVVKQ
ncbi:MAG: o-succinylbenzoate synthase [Kiritimatiellae bacterium]|nr:o-succinylbenzoate synthase [Kiritimatiellia bacterium]